MSRVLVRAKLHSLTFLKKVWDKIAVTLLFWAASAFGASSALPYEIPAVKSLITKNDGRCTGSVIGDKPIKIMTALHCVGNDEDGGVQFTDPQTHALVASKKVYLSNDPKFLEAHNALKGLAHQLEEKTKELERATDELAALAPPSSPLLGLFGPALPPDAKVTEQRAKTMKLAFELQKMDLNIQLKEQDVSMQFPEYDIAVLVFDVSYPGDLSDADRVKALEILPVADEKLESDNEQVIQGGYGGRSMIHRTPGNGKSHFTTNELHLDVRSRFADNVYFAHGYPEENLQRLKITRGESGAPIPGDSGGPALTAHGLSGVITTISPYSASTEPLPGWKNSLSEGYVYKRYDSILSYYPSTSSKVAKEIYAEVEKEYPSIVYAHQVYDYSEIFAELRAKLLATPPEPEAIPFRLFFSLQPPG
jgi:hypothetical protein